MKHEGEHLIPVRILGIYPYGDPQDPNPLFETFLVFLKGREEKVVPISIGRFEGQALAMAMRKVSPARPLPYNLLQDLLGKVSGQVKELVIHTLKDEVFHAYLLVQAQEQQFSLDCRPSDGMTLATLMGVPIYMNPDIMEEAGRELNGLLDKPEVSEVPSAPGADDDPSMLDAGESAPVEDAELSELDKLKAQLDRLVAEEAYEDAARVRDMISRLAEHGD